MGIAVKTSPAFWRARSAVISPRRTIALRSAPSPRTLSHGSPTPTMAATRVSSIAASPLCPYNFILKPPLAQRIASGFLTTSWRKWHATTVKESAGVGVGRIEDRAGRRVRLLRLPGAQGIEGRGHRNRSGEPKHRHHSDLEVDGGSCLLPARHLLFRHQ